jgi:hypothetical protein
MVSIHVDIEEAEWTPGISFYGPAARYDGKDIVQLKVLSDRRAEGGGIAWLGKFSPPPGKLIEIGSKADLAVQHRFKLNLSSRMGSSVPSRSYPPRTPQGVWPAASRWHWR